MPMAHALFSGGGERSVDVTELRHGLQPWNFAQVVVPSQFYWTSIGSSSEEIVVLNHVVQQANCPTRISNSNSDHHNIASLTDCGEHPSLMKTPVLRGDRCRARNSLWDGPERRSESLE
jgi:hypothetical protein